MKTTLAAIAVMLSSLSPARAGDQMIPFEQYKLANGLTVLLHEDHGLPMVAVNLWYRVGSKDEVKGRSGFAHLFEHLMFMGTERVPKFDHLLEAGGVSNNASTGEDRTNYFGWGPSNMIETMLWVEADRLASLGRAMTHEKLDLQRDVVRNERRQGYENRPYAKAWLVIPEQMYPPGHPYAHPVIGSHEDLEAASVQDVKDFFGQFYTPSNASLAVAGDFDSAEARRVIERYFGGLPSGAKPPCVSPPGVPPIGVKRLTIPDKVQLPKIMMIWHSPACYQPGDAELDLAAGVLSQGKNSRLYKRLVYELEAAQSVSAHQASGLLGSNFTVQATAQPGHDLEELEREIDAILAQVRGKPPTDREMKRVKNSWETRFIRRLERIVWRADLINSCLFHTGDADCFEKDRDRYRRATAADVHRWAKEVLDPGQRLVLRIVPEKKEDE